MCIEDGYREHHMPTSHKRWTSYELMFKRVKKRPYHIADLWQWDPIKDWFMTTTLTRDLRDPVTIEAYREMLATDRTWWASIHEYVLTICMGLHPRLGETCPWNNMPEGVIEMIVCVCDWM